MKTINDLKKGDRVDKLQIIKEVIASMERLPYFLVKLVGSDDKDYMFLDTKEVIYCMKNKKIENGIIYADFEIVEYRKNLEILCVGSSRYEKINQYNQKKEFTKKAKLNYFEVGKLYVTADFENDKNLYLYMGQRYRKQDPIDWYNKSKGKVKFDDSTFFAVINIGNIETGKTLVDFVKNSNRLIKEADKYYYGFMDIINKDIKRNVTFFKSKEEMETAKMLYISSMVVKKLSC